MSKELQKELLQIKESFDWNWWNLDCAQVIWNLKTLVHEIKNQWKLDFLKNKEVFESRTEKFQKEKERDLIF